MNSPWLNTLYANRELLSSEINSLLDEKKEKTWAQMGKDHYMEENSIKNKLYKAYREMLVWKEFLEKSFVTDEMIEVAKTRPLDLKYFVPVSVMSNLLSFHTLGSKIINAVGIRNTKKLTIEFVHQKTGIDRKMIDRNLWRYTASEMIEGKEIYCSRNCLSSQVKYWDSSLL